MRGTLQATSANRRKRPDINRFADMAVNDERAVRAIEKRLAETDQSKAKAMEKEQKKLNKRLMELAGCFLLFTRIRSWSVSLS